MKKTLFFICLLSFAFANAQSIKVTGNVTDGTSVPMPGVNVLEKNTTHGVVTDFDGNYSISVSSKNAVLVFSYIGMGTKEVTVGNQTQVNVVMEESVDALDEVVLVGYGTQKREAVTGAVAVADLETYSKVPVNNVIETIKGTIPGLNVGAINSAGAVAGLSIRGTNSIPDDDAPLKNYPLIVVDGSIYNGSLADISPNDIGSLTVLKDASAAAVYGARSGNGVILINTKKGKGINGKPKFSINLNTGITTSLKPLEVYSGEGYLQNIRDIRQAFGQPFDADITQYLQPKEEENYLATPDHRSTLLNPYEAGLQNAYLAKADVSVQNRTDNTSYYISLSVTDQKGVVLNDNFKHFSGRVNLESDLTDWFTLAINASYSLRDLSGSEPDMNRISALSPYASLYDEDGRYSRFPQTTTSLPSPFWAIASEHNSKAHNLLGTIKATIKIPGVKGLTFESTLNNNYRQSNSREFYDEFTEIGASNNGSGSRDFGDNHYQLFDNILRYNRTFAERHNIDLTLLYSKEKTTWESQKLTGKGFDNLVLGSYKLEDAINQNVETGGGQSSALGQMARLTYTFDQKYTVTGTVRRDGFSAFTEKKKFGNFSSVGVNWNISREKFLQDSKTINTLALSVSYGSVGNQAIPVYGTLAKVGTDKLIYADSNTYVLGQGIVNFAQDQLGWETTTGLNMGLDFGFLNNRISGRIDAYRTNTTKLLYNVPLSYISGSSDETIRSNIGEIKNKGIEVTLNTVNLKSKDFEWRSAINFSLNRNEVASLLGDDNDGDGVEDDLVSGGLFIGKPLGTIYYYKVIGMWQQEDEDNGTIMEGMRPGDYKTEDLDGDGKITSDKDRQFIGDGLANFRWSFTNTFTYKNWSLMAYLYSIWGGNGYYQSGGNTPYNDFGAYRTDINHPIYDYWTPTNTDALFPRPDYSQRAAYRVNKYFDRSFIKLQKVALSYDLTKTVKPMGIDGLVLTLSADNLATYAPHWVGLDPETGNGITGASRPSLRTYLLSTTFNF